MSDWNAGICLSEQDVQLAKAIEALLADVKAWKARPQPKSQKATER